MKKYYQKKILAGILAVAVLLTPVPAFGEGLAGTSGAAEITEDTVLQDAEGTEGSEKANQSQTDNPTDLSSAGKSETPANGGSAERTSSKAAAAENQGKTENTKDTKDTENIKGDSSDKDLEEENFKPDETGDDSDSDSAAADEEADDAEDSDDAEDQLTAEEVGQQIQELIETSTQTTTTSVEAVAQMQDQASEIQEAYDALSPEDQELLDDSKEALDNTQASLDTYQDALEEVEETGTVTIDPEAPANSFRYINGQPVSEALANVEQETAQAEAIADGLDPELVQEYNIQPTEGSTTAIKKIREENGTEDAELVELPAAQTELLGAVSGDQHRGIDVSQFQKTIDWDAVKNSGIEFAIIRCGDGPSYNDSQFQRNVSECERLGIPYGVYLYARATSEEAAQQEANHTLALLNGHHPQLPVYYDIEENSMRALGDGKVSSIARTYCTALVLEGYNAGVYSSTSWWQGRGAVLSGFASHELFYHWVAQWAAANTYRGRYECWQYTVGDKGTVPGISTRIDMDYWYGPLAASKVQEFFSDVPDANIPAGVNVMYRMYNPNSGEHLYTASKVERNYLFTVGWNYEGHGWYAPSSSGTPVYRVYNPNTGDHHYTTSAVEKDYLVSIGWNDEGIGWYSAEGEGSIPLYRQFNPNAQVGTHNYTTSRTENDYLVSVGWKEEGIGWFGVSIG